MSKVVRLFLRLLLACYPPDFRRRRGADFLRMLRGDLAKVRGTRKAVLLLAALLDALGGGLRLRRQPARRHLSRHQPHRSEDNMLDQLRQDFSYAMRNLVRRPGWTLAALATLALGIGATTAVFSLVNDVLLRPLPYPNAERLVELKIFLTGSQRLKDSMSFPAYQMVDEAQEALTDFGVFTTTVQTVEIDGGAERMTGGIMSWQVLQALQVEPLRGRPFGPGDDEPQAPRTVLISHGLWQDRLGGDEDVLGRVLHISERPFTVIGVMPPGFVFPDQGPRFWIPMAGLPRSERTHYLLTLGRLGQGVTRAQAWRHFDSLRLEVPSGAPGETVEVLVEPTGLLESLVGPVRPQLWIFMAAVAAVLLIACINVANLLLSRLAGRERELALRSALGAGRRRLLVQMLSESTLLGLMGGAAGGALAVAFSSTMRSLATGYVPRQHLLGIDSSALLFAAVLSLVVGLLVGTLPALRSSRPDLAEGLRESARGSAGSLRHHRLRAALVVAQVALAMVLLVNGGLLVRSLQSLASTEVGFETAGLLTLAPALPPGRYQEPEAGAHFFQQLLERLRGLPAVESAALTATLPFGGGHIGEGLWMQGSDLESEEDALADVQVVGPQFFTVLGLSALQGRLLDDGDRPGAPAAAVVNRTLAQRLFPQGEAVGSRLTLGRSERRREVEIVGVVPDIRPYRLTREVRPMVFESALQNKPTFLYSGVLVRSRPEQSEALLAEARSLLRSIDPAVPLIGVPTAQDRIWASLSSARFRTQVIGAFGFTALLLAMIGVYGVMAYGVVQRTREIGVRMALGARRGQILTWVVRRGLLLTGAGLALGLAGALATSHLLESYLYQLSIHDRLTYAAAAGVLLLAALAASFLPARRASRTDPMEALRCE